MLVSFCVIAYNEEKAIPSLFQDIRNQDYPHDKMEIIFVNAMSEDRTRQLMEEFAKEDNGFRRVVVLDNPKKIQAAGWNVAIKEAQGDIIMRIDAHTMIPKEFVSKNIECIQSGENVSGGPRPNIAEEDTACNPQLFQLQTIRRIRANQTLDNQPGRNTLGNHRCQSNTCYPHGTADDKKQIQDHIDNTGCQKIIKWTPGVSHRSQNRTSEIINQRSRHSDKEYLHIQS